jgi:hypothetical protein
MKRRRLLWPEKRQKARRVSRTIQTTGGKVLANKYHLVYSNYILSYVTHIAE